MNGGFSMLNFNPAYNSGQGVPGTKMEPINKGPKIKKPRRRVKRLKVEAKKLVPASKMRAKYIAHPEPPIRTDEGAR